MRSFLVRLLGGFFALRAGNANVNRLEQIIGYKFRDKTKAEEALKLVDRTKLIAGGRRIAVLSSGGSNLRLAFYGDAVLRARVVHSLYHSNLNKSIYQVWILHAPLTTHRSDQSTRG